MAICFFRNACRSRLRFQHALPADRSVRIQLGRHFAGDIRVALPVRDEPRERRSKGRINTTEKNILKVIEALFLDDLRAEFKRLAERRASSRRKALEAFREKLSELRFFRPGLRLAETS